MRNRFAILGTLWARRTNKEIKHISGHQPVRIQERTRHLNTKRRRDAMRLRNLSAAQRRFWIQRHYKNTGIDAPDSRIFRYRGFWAGMTGHWRESHGSAGLYARIKYMLVLHILFKGHTSYISLL